jgi:hypothetical protein
MVNYEWKKGDKLKCINNTGNNLLEIGKIYTSCENVFTNNSETTITISFEGKEIESFVRRLEKIEAFEIQTIQPKTNKMEKKVYNVLVVNKKTSAVEKNVTVVAENEQAAILKAFGVDAENVYIRTDEKGKFEETKPQTVVLSDEKTKK